MVKLREFQEQVVRTDRRPAAARTRIAIMGMFGELGSLLSEFKKRAREGAGYTSFNDQLIEEAGDLLWYFTALGLDLGFTLDELLSAVWQQDVQPTTTFANLTRLPKLSLSVEGADPWLLAAGRAGRVAEAAQTSPDEAALRGLVIEAMRDVLAAVQMAKISIRKAADSNMEKSRSRFPEEQVHLALYDERPRADGLKVPMDERIPKKLSFDFQEVEIRDKRYVVQKVFQIKLGDPLTDNIGEEDNYRFHDVFHLAYAAILGWSPVLRALLKHKRKSFADLDENEDGARAILIEEGISTYVFNWAKPHYFSGYKRVDYTLLKTIKDFTRGYEVSDQPLWAWERAILRGYDVFRELSAKKRGRVTIDLYARDLFFAESSGS